MVEARIRPLLCLFLSIPLPLTALAADAPTAASLFPDTVVVFAEMPDPAGFVDLALQHPVRQRLESIEGVRNAYGSPQFLQFKAAVAAVEAQLGQTWPKLVKSAAAGGVAVAIDARTQGAAVVITAEDEETPRKLLKSLADLARADAAAKKRPDPIQTKEYRGITVHRVAESRVVVLGKSILATNKAEFGQRIVDMHLDNAGDTLANSELYQQARKHLHADATVWGFVNTAALRQGGVAKNLFNGRADNPVLELLVGGILANLKETPLATFAVSLNDQQLKVELATPHDPAWVGEERDYFFGPGGQGAAPPLLHVKDELFSLAAYRDVSQMWLRAGDLFDDKVNDQLAQADSNLATLFSGKDFGEEILGAVGPQIQLVVARQEFEQDAAQPAIKFPALALALKLKDAQTMQPELRRTFISLIGFLNVIGAMNGQPQLDLDFLKTDESRLVTATYLPEKDADLARLPVNFNFSPSIGFVRDRFIVASTSSLAKELLAIVADDQANPGPPANTSARADLAGLRRILNDNRGQLVAQNMLSEGHTKEEAEQEIGTLLNLLEAAANASLKLSSHGGELRLTLELNFAPHESPAPQ